MKSLRRQITRELLLALSLLLGAGLVAIYTAIWLDLVKAFDAALEARALAVSALAEQSAGKISLDFSERVLRGFSGRARYYFELRDLEDHVIARSLSLHDSPLALRLEKPTGRTEYWSLALPNGRPGRAIRFVFKPKAEPDGTEPVVSAQLIVAVDREDRDETLWGLFAAVAGCGAVLFGAVFFIVPRVLQRGLIPLDQLGERAVAIDARSLGMRFDAATMPLELRPICERLNDLLARLESSFERERRFSADLAHELRTPLAELRTLAECALKWPDTRDPRLDQDTLAIALQMEALVTRLLTLARSERAELRAQLEPVEMQQFLAATWQPFAARAVVRSLAIKFSGSPVTLQADPVLLRSILANLFDNAVDYAPAGTEVAIGCDEHTGIRVTNPNSGLGAADLPHLFDRFWRKEAARSGGKHAGLGLSLARAFAAAMQWQLQVRLENDQVVFILAPLRPSLIPVAQ